MSSMFPNGFQRSWSQTFDKCLCPAGRVMGGGFILIPTKSAPGIYRCAMMGGNAVRIGGQLGGGFLQESFGTEPVILDMGCTPPKAAPAIFVPESVAAMSRSGEIRGSALVQSAEPELSNHRLSRSVRFQRKSWKRPKA